MRTRPGKFYPMLKLDTMGGRRIDLNSADLSVILQQTVLDARKAEVLMDARPFWDNSELRMLPGFGKKTLLKLADVASIVNMDISTVSRVSNSKYIETHFGTFKVKELFSEAFRKDNGELISTKEIKNRLKEIIGSEDKTKPFTDEQLSELLGKEEYHIARRTVAKYREIMKIPSSAQRRRQTRLAAII